MSEKFNRQNVIHWMKLNKNDHIDNSTGELNYTSLVESAAEHFNEHETGGPLDDETHWIWEAALTVG